MKKTFLPSFDWLVFGLILIYSFIIWYPTRYLPFHWDSAGFVINAIEKLRLSQFQPFNVEGSDFAHPPLMIALWAVIWTLTHQSILALHLSMLPFLPILLFSTYLIGKKLVSASFGALSALILATIPVIISEYGLIYLDLPAATWVALSLALYLSRHKALSVVFLTMAVLTKANALLIMPFFILNDYFSLKLKSFSLKPFILYLIPPTVLLAWFGYHYLVSGWFMVIPSAQMSHRMINNLGELWQSTQYIFTEFFLLQSRWIVTLICLLSGVYLLYQRNQKPSTKISLWLLAAMITLGIATLFYIVVAEFTARYVIFLFPLYLVTSLGLFQAALNSSHKGFSYLFTLTGLIVAVIFIFSWYPAPPKTIAYDFRPPSDLSYQDMITVYRQLGVYLQIREPNTHIYGAFPENIYLTQTYQGYVNRPQNFSLCSQFTPQKEGERHLILLHPYSPVQFYCRQLLDAFQVIPLQKFESGSKWLELYVLSSTPAATATISPQNR